MTFGFSGFSKTLSFFGNSTASGCATTPSFGGWSAGGSFGGGSFGGGSFGGHSGGLFGGLKGSFGKLPVFGHDRDDDKDDDGGDDDDKASCGTGNGSSSGSTGGSTGGATGGTGYPDIPANTAGITFHVDLEGDGVEDDYVPIGRDNETKSFEDYLAKARDQVAAEHPDADPKDVIVKATITTQSGEESYYHFTGLEEDSTLDDGQENDDDDNGDGDDCWGHGRDDDEDSDDKDDGDEGRSCGNGHADFFSALTGGGLSFDRSHDRDDDHDDDEDGDRQHGHFDFDFC